MARKRNAETRRTQRRAEFLSGKRGYPTPAVFWKEFGIGRKQRGCGFERYKRVRKSMKTKR
jgi:hypothetical protein